MHKRLLALAIALASSTLATSASAQPAAPAAITAPADQPWVHEPGSITFPAAIDGFARSEVKDLSGGRLLDVSVAYDDPIGRTHVNFYVYHAAEPSTALWFDVAATMIATNSKFGTVTPQADPVAFPIPGATVSAGLRQSFSVTELGRSSGVALIALGEWVIKLRMTSPVYDAAQLDAAMDRMIRQIGWPKTRPPLAAATRFHACEKARPFGSDAKKLKLDGAAVLLGAMAGKVDADDRSKARKKGEAPAPLTLCVHSDRISGRLPIYQGEKREDGYRIPLGDSGELLVVERDSLSGLLLGGKGPAPWSLTVKKHDKWLQYASYDAMPPPAQAILAVQSEHPVSVTTVYGKENSVTLSPDAIKDK